MKLTIKTIKNDTFEIVCDASWTVIYLKKDFKTKTRNKQIKSLRCRLTKTSLQR
jgi:hypothetical protein